MRSVLVIGSGDHGQVVADILLAAHQQGAEEVPIGFLDDREGLVGTQVLGLPVLGTIADLSRLPCDGAIIAIGDNATRRRLFLALQGQGIPWVSAIHPRATVAPNVKLGRGVMICPGAVVETGSVIGDGAILNTNCVVGHHSRVGEFAHICACSVVGGHGQIGEGALIGIGSVIIPRHVVGDWAVVAVRSAATRDVPSRTMAMGMPARVMQWLGQNERPGSSGLGGIGR